MYTLINYPKWPDEGLSVKLLQIKYTITWCTIYLTIFTTSNIWTLLWILPYKVPFSCFVYQYILIYFLTDLIVRNINHQTNDKLMEKSKCKSIPFHVLMNPCNLIKIAKFIVRRDTESQDIFILYFQRTNNFYVLLLEPTNTFLWISIVWLNIMPYKENDSNNILDCEKKKRNCERMCSGLTKCPKSWNWRLWHAFHLYAFLVNSSVKSINKTIKLFLSFVSIYTCLSGLQDFTCKFLSLNLSCFSLVTCL